MVPIGDKPILWHIMKHYRAHGVRDFILCLGYKGEVIRDYFLNFRNYGNDVHVDLSNGVVTALSEEKTDWRITLVDTGATALTGARVKRAAKFIEDDKFFATYGDGVSNIDIAKLLEFHNAEGRKATVTAVRPPSALWRIATRGRRGALIRGKAANRRWLDQWWLFCLRHCRGACSFPITKSCRWRVMFWRDWRHEATFPSTSMPGFWQCMDTHREMQILNDIWARGAAPWKTA
jgi:glucose-1-phosphate cytidylyltransferase